VHLRTTWRCRARSQQARGAAVGGDAEGAEAAVAAPMPTSMVRRYVHFHTTWRCTT